MYTLKAVNISKQSVKDLLVELQESILTGDKPYPPTHGWWWILYYYNTPVGFCGMVKSIKWYNCAYFCRSGIKSSHRGKGFQKKFIKVRIAKAKRLGLDWVVSDTYENPASSNSFIATQFRLFKPTEPWGADGTLYWRKEITRGKHVRNIKR